MREIVSGGIALLFIRFLFWVLVLPLTYILRAQGFKIPHGFSILVALLMLLACLAVVIDPPTIPAFAHEYGGS